MPTIDPRERIKDMKTLRQYPETIKGPEALVFFKNNNGRAGIAQRIHFVDKNTNRTFCGLNPNEHFTGKTYAGAGQRVPICNTCFPHVYGKKSKGGF
jgi:hypothetical protein